MLAHPDFKYWKANGGIDKKDRGNNTGAWDPVDKKWQGGVPLSLFTRIDIIKGGFALSKRLF